MFWCIGKAKNANLDVISSLMTEIIKNYFYSLTNHLPYLTVRKEKPPLKLSATCATTQAFFDKYRFQPLL